MKMEIGSGELDYLPRGSIPRIGEDWSAMVKHVTDVDSMIASVRWKLRHCGRWSMMDDEG